MRRALLLLVAALATCFAPASAKYKTENVFLCVMDGVRYIETFGDPKHQNIPRMWNDLRPQATLYTNFRNTGVTITRQGHSTLATGTWQTCPNGGPRMTMPSFFDYYRDELGISQEKTWAIFGKGKYAWAEYSSFPTYGDRFKPSFEIGIGENSLEDDKKVFARLLEVMEKNHPSLVFVNFGYTDHSGHTGVYEDYLKAIQNVDEIFASLWKKIQSDPVYRDKTTLILTNDHGRHDDSHGGFKGHGDDCEGCRHIMLMILGPDTKKGVEIDREALQIDIAPTIGELLGFQTPLAAGNVLSDCFVSFEGVNKKEARTETAKRAVEAKRLAERDLVRVVADHLVSTLKPANLRPNVSTYLALSGLLAASSKTGDMKYQKAVEEALGAVSMTGQELEWTVLRGALPFERNPDAAQIADLAMSSIESNPVSDLVPAACAFASRFDRQKVRAAELLRKYLEDGKAQTSSELAFCTAETIINCPDNQALGKQGVYQLASLLAMIPECGGLAKDPADSGLALYTFMRMKNVPWWREIKDPSKPQNKDLMPPVLESMTKEEIAKLAAALGEPEAKAPRVAFLKLALDRARTGLPYSIDLLRYSVKEDGSIESRDPAMAAGLFLLISTQPTPEKGRGTAQMK